MQRMYLPGVIGGAIVAVGLFVLVHFGKASLESALFFVGGAVLPLYRWPREPEPKVPSLPPGPPKEPPSQSS